MDTTTSTDAKTAPSPAKCHFLDRPPELRLMIYEELFAASPLDFNKIWSTTRTLPSPALLATCGTIRAEAGKVYLNRLCSEMSIIAKQCASAHAEYKALSDQSGQAVILQGRFGASESEEVAALKRSVTLEQTFIKGKKLVGEELKRWRAQGYVYRRRVKA